MLKNETLKKECLFVFDQHDFLLTPELPKQTSTDNFVRKE